MFAAVIFLSILKFLAAVQSGHFLIEKKNYQHIFTLIIQF